MKIPDICDFAKSFNILPESYMCNLIPVEMYLSEELQEEPASHIQYLSANTYQSHMTGSQISFDTFYLQGFTYVPFECQTRRLKIWGQITHSIHPYILLLFLISLKD